MAEVTTPAPDLMGILGESQRDMQERLAGLHKLGPAYMRAYAEWFVADRSLRGQPITPLGLDPDLAGVIRETVREQAAVARMARRAA